MPTVHNPPPIIPETLRLPDGRTFAVVSLLASCDRPRTINLVTGQPHRGTGATKYTRQDREFLATESLAAIQEKFSVTPDRARRMQYNSRLVLGLPNRPVPSLHRRE